MDKLIRTVRADAAVLRRNIEVRKLGDALINGSELTSKCCRYLTFVFALTICCLRDIRLSEGRLADVPLPAAERVKRGEVRCGSEHAEYFAHSQIRPLVLSSLDETLKGSFHLLCERQGHIAGSNRCSN